MTLKQTIIAFSGSNLRALSYFDGVLAAGSDIGKVFLYTYNEVSEEFEQ